MHNTCTEPPTDAVPGVVHAPAGRVPRWASLITRFVSVQVVVQLASLASGLLLVHVLTSREYAYFTIGNTMQGSMNQLADLGVASALYGVGGKVWNDRSRLGELVRAGLEYRRKLGFVGCAVAAPLLYWQLKANHAPPAYSLWLIAAVIAGVCFQLTSGVLVVVPRLCSRIVRLQRLDLAASLARLGALLACCLLFMNAALAIWIASAAFALQYALLRSWAREDADVTRPSIEPDRREIARVVRQQAPDTIYYCIQGQVTIVLVSVFGHTQTIAQLGALGRLTMLFTVIGSVMTGIVLPGFARCQERRRLLSIYLQVLAGHFVIAALLMFCAVKAPHLLLWLLGRRYAALERELVYVALMASINMIVGVVYSLNSARAWTESAWLSVPLTIAGQLALMPFLDLGSVRGVTMLASLPLLLGVIPFAYRAVRSFQQFPVAPFGGASVVAEQ